MEKEAVTTTTDEMEKKKRDNDENMTKKKKTKKNVCSTCHTFLTGGRPSSVGTLSNDTDYYGDCCCCVVCLNIWNTSLMTQQLQQMIQITSKPYQGGWENPSNIYCRRSTHHTHNGRNNNEDGIPTISISGEFLLRYHIACQSYNYNTTNPTPYSYVLQQFKDYLADIIDSILRKRQQEQQEHNSTHDTATTTTTVTTTTASSDTIISSSFPTIVQHEQQGYLSLHIILQPSSKYTLFPIRSSLPSSSSSSSPTQPQLQQFLQELVKHHTKMNTNSNKLSRKRKRQETQPYTSQGGDPRSNLQIRLVQQQQQLFWTMSAMETAISSTTSSSSVPNKPSRNHHGNDDDNTDNDPWSLLVLPDNNNNNDKGEEEDQEEREIQMNHNNNNRNGIDIHVAVFRRPIYLYGYYTKSRRDISQTPFYVPMDREDYNTTTNDKEVANNKKEVDMDSTTTTTPDTTTTTTTTVAATTSGSPDDTTTTTQLKQQQQQQLQTKCRQKRLGISSVEEEICHPIQRLIGGISTCNNYYGNSSKSKSGSGGIVYGMCKFHASGREDMNVRMVLRKKQTLAVPATTTTTTTTAASAASPKPAIAKGRPFCLEIIDALGPPPSLNVLREMEHVINHTTTNAVENLEGNEEGISGSDGGGEDGDVYWYGRNPMGVGIEPNALTYVSSKAFSTLQSDTESKRKQYGCLVWTQRELPFISPQDIHSNNNTKITGITPSDLTKLLLSGSGDNSNNNANNTVNFSLPLTVRQSTPIRVVHRRAPAIRERRIYELEVTRIIDAHHFHLKLSTQAGTYVKEFVHGDLQRTQPNIANMLGGYTTDLLELDCEGIQLNHNDVDEEGDEVDDEDGGENEEDEDGGEKRRG